MVAVSRALVKAREDRLPPFGFTADESESASPVQFAVNLCAMGYIFDLGSAKRCP